MEYELHPLCVLFPRMVDDAFLALTKDIRENGLREPIVVHDGMILDGGNRYRACLQAGVEPTFREFDGDNLVTFVLSANLHRRHMTAGQQAAIVASAQDWAKAQPASRPEKAGNLAPLSEKAGNLAGLSTVADRAAQSGASERTQRMADKVARKDPDLAAKVARGEVSLPKAVETITGKRPGAKPAEQAEHEAAMEEVAKDFDPIAELEAAQREIAMLNARIKAMSVDDTGKELAKQIEIRQGIEGRLAQETTKVHELDRQLRRMGKVMEELRKLTGAESNSGIVPAVRALVRKAA